MAKRQTWIFSNSSWNWYKQQTEIRCLFVLQLQKAYQQLYQDYKAGIIYHFLFSFVKSALDGEGHRPFSFWSVDI